MRVFIMVLIGLLCALGSAQISQWTLLPQTGSNPFPRIRVASNGDVYVQRQELSVGNLSVIERRSSDGTLIWQWVGDALQFELDKDGNVLVAVKSDDVNLRYLLSLAQADGNVRFAVDFDAFPNPSGRDPLAFAYLPESNRVVCLVYDGAFERVTVVSSLDGSWINSVAMNYDSSDDMVITATDTAVYLAGRNVSASNQLRVTKLDLPTLTTAWSVEPVGVAQVGWLADEFPAIDIIPDSTGNVYIGCQQNGGPSSSIKIVKISGLGQIQWIRELGDALRHDYYLDMTLSEDLPVVAGKIQRDQLTLSMVKLNTDGSTRWSRYLVGTNVEWNAVAKLASGPDGTIALAGRAQLSDAGYREDAFACRFRADGVGLWAYTYNGASNLLDQFADVAFGPSGAVHAIGKANGGATALIVKLLTAQMTFSPTTVIGGVSATGTVSLNEAAPPGGVLLSLSDPSASLSTPASVLIPGGSTSADFTATTTPVASSAGVTVTGQNSTVVVRGRLSIAASTPSTVTVTPNQILGGQSGVGTVTMTGNAAAGGVLGAIYESSPALYTFPTVYVPSGQSQGSFMVFTVPVAANTAVSISVVMNGITKSTSVTVLRPSLVAISTIGSTFVGSDSFAGTVYINGRAPDAGVSVTLTSDSAKVSPQTTVVIEGDSKSGGFTATTQPVVSNSVVTLTASYGGTTKTCSVTITPPTHGVVIAPDVLQGGTPGTGMVVLSHPAPAGGVTVALTTGAPSLVGLPASVFIPEGGSSRAFTFTTNSVQSNTVVAIFGSFNGVVKRKDIVLVP